MCRTMFIDLFYFSVPTVCIVNLELVFFIPSRRRKNAQLNIKAACSSVVLTVDFCYLCKYW